MSDFLVSVGRRFPGEGLLKLLTRPYGNRSPAGKQFDFAWGSAAVLSDRVLAGQNVFEGEHGVFAAVGDLVVEDMRAAGKALLSLAAGLRTGQGSNANAIQNSAELRKLNGAFGVLLLDDEGPSIITDPLGALQVYAGCDKTGRLVAIGTHPDLVACLADESREIDPISVFEFLNAGTPCFPRTMYVSVTELGPGRVHYVHRDGAGVPGLKDACYWAFPAEFDKLPDEEELIPSLRRALLSAVEERCRGRKVGVTLSGGLDSRLILAAIPKEIEAIGFTFCDVINREARLARKVARCYGREWVTLFRDQEYIAQTAAETVRFIGCECEWVHAHGIGFVEDFARHNLGAVLHGLGMNNNFKLWHAGDIRRVPRLGGLLPAKYEIVPYDYAEDLKAFSPTAFQEGLLEKARARRKTYVDEHPGRHRQSVAEWLEAYPTSQGCDNALWIAERRLMPVRMVALDRRLLDIACRIPALAKVENRLFVRMASGIFGIGSRIPNASDGIRPGSSHPSRLLQRAVRRIGSKGREVSGRLGMQMPVPHSWHDYPRYWQESEGLRQLIKAHGSNLQEFENTVFKGSADSLLADRNIYWQNGFRLVQLALWLSIIREYRALTSALCAQNL